MDQADQQHESVNAAVQIQALHEHTNWVSSEANGSLTKQRGPCIDPERQEGTVDFGNSHVSPVFFHWATTRSSSAGMFVSYGAEAAIGGLEQMTGNLVVCVHATHQKTIISA